VRYGPSGGRRLVYFVDDMNMPFVDKYDTQSAIELLRQMVDYHGWCVLRVCMHVHPPWLWPALAFALPTPTPLFSKRTHARSCTQLRARSTGAESPFG